jgi:penicillin-binding protein 1B
VLLVVIAAVAALGVGIAAFTRHALDSFAATESRRTAFLYATGQRLAPGVHTRLIDLAGTLARLDYRETSTSAEAPGQFHRGTGAWDIVLRVPEHLDAESGARRVTLELRGERIARVLVDGVEKRSFRLESEVLASVDDASGDETRPARLREVPQDLVRAVLAIEDHRFFAHGGLDLRALARAAWVNTRRGHVAQGGSTITQQLVKNRLLSTERTYARKLREAWLAAVLEWRYPKDTILEAYLNEIYLGQRGGLAIHGVGAAARIFFGKEIHQIDLAEAALLAGMIRAPNTYSPLTNPAKASERRAVVLSRMQQLEWISAEQEAAARAAPLPKPNLDTAGQPAAYFTDLVRQQLEDLVAGDGDVDLGIEAARVYTTLDVSLQRFAEAAVTDGLARIERDFPRLRRDRDSARLQAALVALAPASGEVVALVGGRDYRSSQFNRAVFAERQPGSAFKPFVFAAALMPREGYAPLTLASHVDDDPITLTVGTRTWSPRNHDNVYEGRVTLRRALERSLNAATVRVAGTVGLEHVVDMAERLGVASALEPTPALALGAYEVTPLELATAYEPFANGGRAWNRAGLVRAAFDVDGFELFVPPMQALAVLTAAEAYLMTSLLQGVIERGTASSVRSSGIAADLAGKTGTSNDGRDAWFVGYSPRLLALVWVGFDDGSPHGLSAAQAAVPIWADFMKRAIDAYPVPAFEIPDGVTSAEVDITNGRRANRFCPARVREVFLVGTEPPLCEVHVSPVDRAVERARDGWRRFRDWLGR